MHVDVDVVHDELDDPRSTYRSSVPMVTGEHGRPPGRERHKEYYQRDNDRS